MNENKFKVQKFVDDVTLGIRKDDDSIQDSIESTIVITTMPLIFSTIGPENVPLGFYLLAAAAAGLDLRNYIEVVTEE